MTVTISGTSGVSLVQDSTITSAKIVDGTIAPADLALAASSIGVGQVYQNFTIGSTRVFGTTYTNNIGKPIVVDITYGDSSSGTSVITVGGISLGSIITNSIISSASWKYQFLVPVGATYSISSGANITTWSELA